MCFPGAIFDKDSILSHTAFRYEVERHNNSSATVKLEKYEKDANILGNFELSKASEYNGIYFFVSFNFVDRQTAVNIAKKNDTVKFETNKYIIFDIIFAVMLRMI